MVNRRVVIICCIIALIIMGTILYIKALELDRSFIIEEVEDNTTDLNDNNVVNIEINENNTINNDIPESNVIGKEELESQNEVSNIGNTSSSEELNDSYAGLTGKEKAIAMAKKQWGENDKSVYYFIDRTNGNIYNISVRSKSTTESLAEYEIDIENNTIK